LNSSRLSCSMDDKLLLEIAKRPFDGHYRKGMRRGKGERRDFIVATLRKARLEPREDRYGNVWVESGKTGRQRLLSSHMDVDPLTIKHSKGIRVRDHPRHGKVYKGILDNAVGCYLNLKLATSNKNGRKTIHIFTTTEEPAKKKGRDSKMSADNVVKTLRMRKIKPSVCVAIDVTYPGLKVPARRLAEVWDDTEYSELFDVKDGTQTYVDGITGRSRRKATNTARQLINHYKKNGGRQSVQMRELSGWDEAQSYSKIAPSFAYGPVGYGKFDEPNQTLPKKHLATALRFLRRMTAVE